MKLNRGVPCCMYKSDTLIIFLINFISSKHRRVGDKIYMFSLLSRHMRGQVKLRVSNFRRIAFIRTQISRFTVDRLDVSRQQRKHVFITDTTVF